jgi:trk system potassium uptake protein TrkA
LNIVILGCGRVGARVASVLSASHDVTIIDWNRASFARLDQGFAGTTIVGNGIDIDVLRRAHAGDGDVFLALTNGDNRNIMSGQVARILGAKQVIVRVYDATRAEIFCDAGLQTVSPTVMGADRLFEMVVGHGERT